jgi:hypothetical protein
MNRFPILRIILAGAAVPFLGCQGTGTSTEMQPTGLYRCIGESGYAPGELEKIIADLKQREPECTDERPVAMGPVTMGIRVGDSAHSVPTDPAVPADSIRVHAVVLDERCRLVRETVETLPDPHRSLHTMMIADMRDASGMSVETGVYYVNVSVERAGSASDTSYGKIGFYRDPCSQH